MNIQEAIIYLEKVAVARGLSSTTLLTYRTSINRFNNWFKGNVEDISELVLIDFINYLRKQGLSNVTIKKYTDNLLNFLKILIGFKVINQLNIDLVPKVKLHQTKKKIIPNEQLGMIISTNKSSTTNTLKKYLKVRDNFIIKLFLLTGLRVSELCNLTLNDISGNKLLVNGKGNKERIVPLISTIQAELQQYLGVREAFIGNKSSSLFLSRNATKLTPNSVRAMMDKLGNNYGIENLHPHALRHSFATNLVLADVNVVAIQQLLGHENLSTTSIYIGQLPINNLGNAVEKAYANIKL